MADEIRLKAPTVEQQIVIQVNGEEKIKSLSDTLDRLSNNKNLQKYWKTQQELINATTDAYGNFQKKASKDNASELIKVTNALKAVSGTDLSQIVPDFSEISKSLLEAQKIIGNIDEAFSVKTFKEAFDSFETLKAYGVDIEKLFSHFGVSTDVSELQQNVRLLENEVGKLTRRLSYTRDANEALRSEFESYKTGSGFADKLDELDNLQAKMADIRAQAQETFSQFLELNNISRDGYDEDGYYDDDRFRKYFDAIQEGSLTATDAITEFKREYAYLLEESFKSSDNNFGLDQFQEFSDKLDSIFHQVEETSNKINSIIENGVIAKSVQNLSEDTFLSDPQRSLFGDLLKDEESLKSVTTLFQKLIEESQKTKNTDVFNEGQFEEIKKLFRNIEQSLSAIKGVLVDVGDGEELSPLLKKLEEIRETSANIKVGFSFDLGDGINERLNQRVSQATTRQLEAYRNLFSAMKSTGKTNKEMLQFFEPDDASVSELIGMYKSIIKRATEQFKIGNSNIYKDYLGSTYDELQKEVKRASDQLSRAEKKQSDNGILSELFGSQDLSGVIEQLKEISKKLEEISTSAKKFAESFKGGLNITTSIAEVETLTNRVEELEEELAKLKDVTNNISPVSQVKENTARPTSETNISSGSTTSAIDNQIKKQNEYNDLVAVGYDRIQKMKKISESGTTGSNSVYDLLRLNHEAWDEVKANNFFNKIPEKGLKRYTKILEVVERIVQEMVQASGLTEEQIVTQLKNIKTAQGGSFKLNGADSGWTHFATYSNGQKDSMQKVNGITYKVYAAFDDIKDLNQNVVSSIMDELTKAGFKGRLKTTSGSTSFGDKLNGLAITDQMVVHGSTKKDQEIAYNTLKNMGLKLSYLGGGIDTPDGSFSQTLASGEINKYIQGLEKEATAAKETAKAEQQLAEARKESSSTTSQGQLKDAFQGENGSGNSDTKLDKMVSSAKDLDKTLDQVDIPTDSFDEVLEKLDRSKSELVDIVKITRQSISDADGKFSDSYTLKDSRGSTEIYGMSSKTDKGQILRQNIVGYDVKQDAEIQTNAQQKKWKAFLKEQADYEKSISEVNVALLKTDELLDKLPLHDKLDDQFLNMLDSIDGLNSKLQSSELTLDEYKSKVKSITSEYSEMVKEQKKIDTSNKTTVKKAESSLASYINKLSGYEKTFNKFQAGGWTSNAFTNNIQIAREALKEYKAAVSEVRQKTDVGIVTQEDINNVSKLEIVLKDAINTIKSMSASEKGFDLLKGQKELDKIHSLLRENTAMSSDAKKQIKAYYNEIASGNPSASLDVIHGKIMKIVNAETEAGRGGKRLLSVIGDKAWYGLATTIGTYFGLNDVIRYIQQAAEAVIELNTNITELAKVSEQTTEQIYSDFDSYADIAKKMGATISDTISATADWSRNGYNIPDSKELAEVALLYKNVGDGIDIDAANASLISTLQGFELEADQAEHIIDVFNEVSNNEAISSSGIGEALQNSAAAFNAANTSLEESVALVSATNSVLQDPSKVGNAHIADLYSNVMKIKSSYIG